MIDLTGLKINNYKLLNIIGRGGMGVVYKAYDYQLDRNVCIKFLNYHLLSNYIPKERFRKEAVNHAKLSHPNIVTVHGLVEYQDSIGIVMEYIKGHSLDYFLRKYHFLTLSDSVYIIKQALAGIGYAHAKGFIHRDIKPSNIILDKEGFVKVLDFGIARNINEEQQLTKSLALIGTVNYMSPEQIMGEPVGRQSDIYSIGCTFYEMLAGVPPFVFDSEYKVMDAHLTLTPLRLNQIGRYIPTIIEEIIFKAISKNPYERFLSCEDFIYELNRAERISRTINMNTVSESIKPKQKKISFLSFIGIVLFIIFLILALIFTFMYVDSLLEKNEKANKRISNEISLVSEQNQKQKFI